MSHYTSGSKPSYLVCSSKKGFGTRQLHRTNGGSMKTTWFLGHRIREAMTESHEFFHEPLGGPSRVVEGEATYMGRKAKSRAFRPPGRKQAVPPGRKQAVMTPVERGGPVRSFHVPSVTAANWQPIIARHVPSDSRYVTDSRAVAPGLPFRVYTNTVEGYIGILKR
jgi:hypothetical protein